MCACADRIGGLGGIPQYKPTTVGRPRSASRGPGLAITALVIRALKTLLVGQPPSFHTSKKGGGVRPTTDEAERHRRRAGTGAATGTGAAGEARLDLSLGHFRTHTGAWHDERNSNCYQNATIHCCDYALTRGPQSGGGSLRRWLGHLVECPACGQSAGISERPALVGHAAVRAACYAGPGRACYAFGRTACFVGQGPATSESLRPLPVRCPGCRWASAQVQAVPRQGRVGLNLSGEQGVCHHPLAPDHRNLTGD